MKHQNIPYLSNLKASYRNYFESYLAIYILHKANKLNAIVKLTNKVLYLIDNNEKLCLSYLKKIR